MKRFVYDYSKPLNKDEVNVFLLDLDKRKDLDYILNGIFDSSESYNFNFQKIDLDTFEENNFIKLNSKVRLLIVLCEGGFNDDLVKKAVSKINKSEFTCVSFAFSFKDENQMYSCVENIEKYKAISNDRINFLRPNEFHKDSVFVSKEKIVDNSICDSVRVKYIPKINDQSKLILSDKIIGFFKNASDRYGNDVLYHRSPSDGYFAVRSESNPESFYITATKTYKDKLDPERISEVLGYNKETNELVYNGNFLPSSDSVEAAVIFKMLPNVKTLIHTHASVQFTRNKHYLHKVTVPIAPYGEHKTGLLVVDALKNENDGFIIMEDHGEVFAYDEYDVSKTLLHHLTKIKETTHDEIT